MIDIAIVEDDPKAIETLREYLTRFQKERNEQFFIHVFYNVLEFLEQYRATYDIVFMDIEMPYMDGMKAAEHLRVLNETVLLIFVTNMSQFAMWGFQEMFLTDMTDGVCKSQEVGYRIGNDIWMNMQTTELDLSTPATQWCARNAVDNVGYVVVNSNACI